jgi:hypothetical protein
MLASRWFILLLSAVVGSTWLMGARADVGDAALSVEGGGIVVPEEGWTTAGRVRGLGQGKGEEVGEERLDAGRALCLPRYDRTLSIRFFVRS